MSFIGLSELIVYGFFIIVMEIPNLRQGLEKTVKTSVAIFQKYILYWSRLFYFGSDVEFYGVVERLYLGMPGTNTDL